MATYFKMKNGQRCGYEGSLPTLVEFDPFEGPQPWEHVHYSPAIQREKDLDPMPVTLQLTMQMGVQIGLAYPNIEIVKMGSTPNCRLRCKVCTKTVILDETPWGSDSQKLSTIHDAIIEHALKCTQQKMVDRTNRAEQLRKSAAVESAGDPVVTHKRKLYLEE